MKFFGLEISQKVLIGVITGIVVIGGVTVGIITMNHKDNPKDEQKQEVTCNQKSGSWTTTEPTGCEYTTKDIVWRWQMIMDTDGNERWAWTVDFIFEGIGAGSAEPKDITDNRYDVYPYLSTEPKETYTDNQEHEKTVTVYITK